MIAEVLASFELAIRATDGVRLVPYPEIVQRAKRRGMTVESPFRFQTETDAGHVTIVPDAVFGIEYRTATKPLYRFIALEADRGTMPVHRADFAQSSFGKKIAAYRQIFSTGLYRRLGLPNLIILAVTADQNRVKRIGEAVGAAGVGSVFLLRAIPEPRPEPLPDLFSAPWRRVGCPDVDLARVG